ncbi:ribosome biogenesis GTP-binding protein YihA/YsxC [Oleiharenicola lentus]|uniref:ribosome biogenesis GTP-binding protein YihA/YsxC n=1 Tax=Oleiharenicola lentus TaxID=2508720 RepID=UPI003F661005
MKIKSAVFTISCPNLQSCKWSPLPEFAFIGRSNVGKSSLINLLSERNDLAKVSNVPGKTKLMNFFTINNAWTLVDLPGYGYAHVSKENRADFNEAAADFIENRENLACVFVLIDSRLPPQEIDIEFLGWIAETDTPFALIFTKTDKQSIAQTKTAIERFSNNVLAELDVQPEIFSSSSKTKFGRTQILNFIEQTIKQK